MSCCFWAWKVFEGKSDTIIMSYELIGEPVENQMPRD